jgi:hypothetical protein
MENENFEKESRIKKILHSHKIGNWVFAIIVLCIFIYFSFLSISNENAFLSLFLIMVFFVGPAFIFVILSGIGDKKEKDTTLLSNSGVGNISSKKPFTSIGFLRTFILVILAIYFLSLIAQWLFDIQ